MLKTEDTLFFDKHKIEKFNSSILYNCCKETGWTIATSKKNDNTDVGQPLFKCHFLSTRKVYLWSNWVNWLKGITYFNTSLAFVAILEWNLYYSLNWFCSIHDGYVKQDWYALAGFTEGVRHSGSCLWNLKYWVYLSQLLNDIFLFVM